MYKIIIKGLSGEASTDSGSVKDLSILDGEDCEDCFSDYFHESGNYGQEEQPLIDKEVKSGYMHFEYNKSENKLYVVVEYTSKEELNKEELELLVEYTQGQLSDGIGESYEQSPCIIDDNDEEVFVSPWYYGQKLTVTQEKNK